MELRGNLKDFSLPDIIQLVGFGRKTGVLKVDCGDGASLFFDEGQVIHAEHEGTVGEEAVYGLFAIATGEFQFHTEVPSPHRTITLDSTNLVMEAARRLDESRRENAPEGNGGTAEGAEEWPGFEDRPRDPHIIKEDIRSLLKRRFGRDAKRLLQAVDRCGDSAEDLLELTGRVEKYVHVFLDAQAARTVGQEIRALLSSPSSS